MSMNAVSMKKKKRSRGDSDDEPLLVDASDVEDVPILKPKKKYTASFADVKVSFFFLFVHVFFLGFKLCFVLGL